MFCKYNSSMLLKTKIEISCKNRLIWIPTILENYTLLHCNKDCIYVNFVQHKYFISSLVENKGLSTSLFYF